MKWKPFAPSYTKTLANHSAKRNTERMKLSQYLAENGLTLGALAKTCGTSASTILRIKTAEVAPSQRVARAIWEATNGQVTPNDLYGLDHAAGHCPCHMAKTKRDQQG